MSKDLLKQLVVTEEDLLAEAVEKAKGLIAIEDKSGNVIVRLPKTSLPARTLIHLYLIGTYFSHRMGKTEFPSMSPTALSLASGIDPSTISARLTELVNAGSVKKTERGQGKYPKGEYSINPYMMNELLDEILRALRHNSMIFSDGSVTGTLTLMYQDHRLRRVKEGRSFRYLVP